jgi:hypothetical protein
MVLAGVTLATVIAIAAAPTLHRRARNRQEAGDALTSFGGVGGGLDAVWRPSAEEAHAQWQAQLEVPAPAPSPGDGGDLDAGRIVIRLPHDSTAVGGDASPGERVASPRAFSDESTGRP